MVTLNEEDGLENCLFIIETKTKQGKTKQKQNKKKFIGIFYR